ncbi:hypothetical protein STCU_11889 [Strigomonas culicis]|uniref:Uncharacterized protein n=1 Tax=Strigomonas culicis TaxID=28005 RepID=S9TFD5_9TRYP|nr:hypothetical protein STCU_11889 [Strigomonas culicis]|eukprot:EPY15614.1 hypothetical protein STCU_11889 [Strigomonas culicis]
MLGLGCTGYPSTVYLNWRYQQYCRRVLAERARLRGEGMAERVEEGTVVSVSGTKRNACEEVPEKASSNMEQTAPPRQ